MIPPSVVAPSIPVNKKRKGNFDTEPHHPPSESTKRSRRSTRPGPLRNPKNPSGHYSKYLFEFLKKVFKMSFSLHFLHGYAWWSKMAGWRHVSKREILLRLPTICRTSFHYYSLKIVASQTATFFLKIKRFKEDSSFYWYRSQSSATQSKRATSEDHGHAGGGTRFKSKLSAFPFYNYFRSLKWFPIPLTLGFALLAYQHYGRVLRRGRKRQHTTAEESINQDWEITCYRKVPWKSVSRAWGWVNGITLPEWARGYVLGWYASTFHCDLDEAETDDLRQYKNLGEFFRRNLKDGMRPIHLHSPVVSPADGTIFHVGRVQSGAIEQVKGVRYSLQTFLGPQHKSMVLAGTEGSEGCTGTDDYCAGLLKNPNRNGLFYCVIYLAPGDYHRFHSPADWEVKFRRHFSGELLSVNASIANWIGGLFSLNERAVYTGEWKHGFFSMTAVGATNVGSIRVYEDSDLHTNARGLKKNAYAEKLFEKPISLRRGDCFGEFNLGSTIVIIFEAPTDFCFTLEQSQRVKVGAALIDTAVVTKGESLSENLER